MDRIPYFHSETLRPNTAKLGEILSVYDWIKNYSQSCTEGHKEFCQTKKN